MNACRRESGKSYLAGSLDEVGEACFVDHLEHCPQCQRWLEQDAGDEEWSLARELLTSPVASCETKTLHRTFPELAFLAPTDDPTMMGRVGAYEIMGILGRGGMGIVLKGFDRALGRNVAIKLLDPVLANHGAARQRFAREARAMAAISHEHVVPVFAVDEHANLPYFVMEYVPGGTLECRLHRTGRLEVVEVVRIGLQVAAALAAAHRHGLVHRDIKPSNVLLDQGTERVRVADFGLARAVNDASYTRSSILAGTPLYMAPEQVRGETCDGQSDLFSLGSLMYALCVGHPPFREDSMFAVLERIVRDEPRSLREQNPQVPGWLEDLILLLLKKEKSERFGSAEELTRVLESELAHLQNPHLKLAPSRGWRRSARTFSPRVAKRLRPAAAIIAAAALVGATWWLWNGSHPPEVDDRGRLGARRAAITVPLWDYDGTRSAFAEIHQLESDSNQASDNPLADPWRAEAGEMRRRFDELSAELQVPWSTDPQ